MRSTVVHYEGDGKKDVIDICKDYDLNFNRGNIVKYVIRAGRKQDEIRDLEKAKDYIQRELDHLRSNRDQKNMSITLDY
jgi:hypothetical protein